ncbi:hypothetical protein NLJ89_g4140 [Agrocybe chaxingu]|uniref:Uncharacterized protein n=1 Tax=Agrocybe chaxingu TaxID=84603 RepID=A0A9W8K396_9AGAR|nr:hypothetical protein NLJ89_g4140 [Agrocybe chaxingu]
MAETIITAPIATAMLSTLSSNPRAYAQARLPLRESPSPNSDPDMQKLAKLLDAIASFLPTKPKAGLVYAMTLRISATSSHITIAGNNADHFKADAEGRHPEATINTIWSKMRSICTSEGDERKHRIEDLLIFLFKTHMDKMRARYQKGDEICRIFFNVLDTSNAWNNLPEGTIKLLENAQKIYSASTKFFALSDDVETYMAAFHQSLIRSQREYTSKKDDLTLAHSAMYEKLAEEQFDATMGAVGSTSNEQRRRPRERFSLDRYMGKLVSPAVHALSLLSVAGGSLFRRVQHLPLFVTVIHPARSSSFKIPFPDQATIRSFLEDAYGDEDVSEEIDVRTLVIDERLLAIGPELTGHKQLNGPHCECFLINHHHTLQDVPYPYIGVSKLSCLQCGLYIEAYQAYVKQQTSSLPLFRTRGCRADVIPYLLPSASTAMDTFIEEHIISAVKQVVGVILRSDAAEKRAHWRKQSQSTAASSDSEDSGEYHFEGIIRGKFPTLLHG